MTDEDNTDVISRLGEFLSIDREEVIARLEELDVDTTMEVLDAVANDDQGKVAELMNSSSNEDVQSTEEQDVDDLSPLFTKSSKSSSGKKDDEAPQDNPVDEGEYYPNLGDSVMVGDQQAVVKIPRAPGNTVGVMIDGDLAMVAKSEITPVKESVLGMVSMPGIQRMQELAGIMPNVASEPVQVTRVGTVDMSGDEENTFLRPRIANVNNVDADCALSSVMDALDAAESALGDLKVKDAKDVRARLSALMTKLNESTATGRCRKV